MEKRVSGHTNKRKRMKMELTTAAKSCTTLSTFFQPVSSLREVEDVENEAVGTGVLSSNEIEADGITLGNPFTDSSVANADPIETAVSQTSDVERALSDSSSALGSSHPVDLTNLVDTLQSMPTVTNVSSSIDVSKPYHPLPSTFIIQTVVSNKGKNTMKKLTFQASWYETFPWLHYREDVNGVICFYCNRAKQTNMTTADLHEEPTFVTAGFANWKKAKEIFHSMKRHSTITVQCNIFKHKVRQTSLIV
jgi:hypothetical protein